ncbi:hypothetical protein KL930_000172 [Ogataea haglerorum]|uniref:Uncharacterized protein n=1 Tax=Ogataea haglerorum TaxID=1937702 RepID=A0AAN6I136_9ASCO|nr:uncharacterized protein KL911_000960 [Ogataea haglerorum]KAG7697773.1 hypothetical protein KL951_002347 [Ogataea haglerorum]KAG7706594.1 hypothetical protein KL950_003259 [Ogataea haglerorum]KAG7709333.1 hypothetical protein KL914_001723 [Ogataea haglerorum]KAG7717804.1 hypothetical protein KL913_002740 [Ogataea haglerorum]KAG7718106.1 hypothetical protein KL949_003078 [Ogataea haglerorum]
MNISAIDSTPGRDEFQHFKADFFKSRSLSVGTDASGDLSGEGRSRSPLGKLTRKLRRAVLPVPIATTSDSLSSVISASSANTSPATSPSANLKLLSPLMPAPPPHAAPRDHGAPDIADEYFLRHQQRSAGRAHQAGSISASSATDFDSLYSLDDPSDRVSLRIRASSDLLLGAQVRELNSLLAATHDSPGWSVRDGLLIPADTAPDPKPVLERLNRQ